ncbi:hypothetical protein C8F04DRAFT_1200110 [Mycena alexandri]|uniref:Phosphatidylglycerol/phosphatidylinositol transfer protein n=1 Tax=Mycena alexandri TaxID=1745969 RepID=A0AAD6RYA3_9AGAR|nr:hypothetical protein C8F04DRAFT_1200110 [Mycena alexandri]
MHLLKSLAITAFLATSALAQSIVVDAPRPGANIPLTSTNLTVQIERPDTLSASKEVSVAIGYKICDVDEGCGPGAQLLYNGPYTPTQHTQTLPGQPSFYQKFTFPSPFFTPGPVEITVVHFFDIGAGENIPFVETVNIDFNIV